MSKQMTDTPPEAANFDATAPQYLARMVGISRRVALRLRIMQDHDPWADTEVICLGPGVLPEAEDGVHKYHYYVQ